VGERIGGITNYGPTFRTITRDNCFAPDSQALPDTEKVVYESCCHAVCPGLCMNSGPLSSEIYHFHLARLLRDAVGQEPGTIVRLWTEAANGVVVRSWFFELAFCRLKDPKVHGAGPWTGPRPVLPPAPRPMPGPTGPRPVQPPAPRPVPGPSSKPVVGKVSVFLPQQLTISGLTWVVAPPTHWRFTASDKPGPIINPVLDIEIIRDCWTLACKRLVCATIAVEELDAPFVSGFNETNKSFRGTCHDGVRQGCREDSGAGEEAAASSYQD